MPWSPLKCPGPMCMTQIRCAAFPHKWKGLTDFTASVFYPPPLTDSNRSREKRMVFGCNIYGMHEMDNYGKYQGSLILSIDLRKAPIILPTQQEGTTYFLLTDVRENIFSFNCPEDITRSLLECCEKKNALTT